MSSFFCCLFPNKGNSVYLPVEESFSVKLEKLGDLEKVPLFSLKGKRFVAKPSNIYDGDTFSVIFEHNGNFIKYRCRCLGYDTPEMKPLKSNENRLIEKELAIKAKLKFEELLNKHETKMVKIDCFDFDKYGRLLVTVWNMVDEKSINDIMVDEGYGKVYDGGKKELW